MRLLLDNNLSRKVADILRRAGHDVVHVREMELHTARDEVILGTEWKTRRRSSFAIS